jgi:hypothetical protein
MCQGFWHQIKTSSVSTRYIKYIWTWGSQSLSVCNKMVTELGNHKKLICLTHVHILCVPNVQIQCIDLFLSTMFSMSDILILYYYITGPAIPPGALSPPIFSGISVALSLVFCVVFWRWLFVLLSFFAWPLCCLSFDLRILITHLVSSNSSYPHVLILVLIPF